MFVCIIPECSGCLAIDSRAAAPILPIPIPAPTAESPAPIAAIPVISIFNNLS